MALIITIVVLVILATVTIQEISGDGIISRAKAASFRAEITAVKENLELAKLEIQMFNSYNSNITEEMLVNGNLESIPVNDINEFDDQLKFEIIYWGKYDLSSLGISKISKKYIRQNIDSILNEILVEDTIKNLYYIKSSSISNTVEVSYLYDSNVNIIYKIKGTSIGVNKVHSIEELDYVGVGDNIKEREILISKIQQSNNIIELNQLKYYSPDLTGLVAENTKAVYYETKINEAGKKSLTGKSIELPITEYLETNSAKAKDNELYEFYDYANNFWANIKVENDGVISYWVWIPRYAYKIDGTTTEIKFIDLDNKDLTTELPLDTNSYIVHSAFESGGTSLSGVWISKYETSIMSKETSSGEFYIPDLTGLNKDNTYIEVYDSNSKKFTETKLADISNLSEFCKNNKWYDYENKIWANIKVVTDNIESWWVWIPRYAYSILGTETAIKFVDLNGNPLDGSKLDSNYVQHPAFDQVNEDGNTIKLTGIWVSKYELSIIDTTGVITKNANKPDMSNLNIDTTYIEIYNTQTKAFRDVKLREVLKDTSNIKSNIDSEGNTYYTYDGEIQISLQQNEVWYDYKNKIWANIKVVTDNVESWWVWIPRYAYDITGNLTSIMFLDGTSSDINTNGDRIPENYIEHSAFNQTDEKGNTIKLTGIWVSKYELSTK